MKAFLFKLGFRNIWRKKNTSLTTILSIALSIAFLVSVFVSTYNLDKYTYSYVSKIGGDIDLTITNSRYQLEISETLQQYIKDYPGIKYVSPRIEGYQIDIVEAEILFIVGLDLELDSPFGYFELRNGSINIDPINTTFFNCLITRSYSLMANFSIGDIIHLDNQYLLNISGIVNAYDKGIIGNIVVVSLEAARIIYDMNEGSCNKLNVMVDDIRNINQIKNDLNSQYAGLYIRSPKIGILQIIEDVLGNFFNYLLVITLITAFFAAYKIFSTVSENFKDRISEFGVFRTIGYSKSQIIRLNSYEVVFQSLLGAGIGIPLGIAFTQILLIITKQSLNLYFPHFGGFNPALQLNLGLILLAVCIGLIISTFSALHPILKYSKYEIIDVIQFNKRKEPSKGLTNKLISHKSVLFFSLIILSTSLFLVFFFQQSLNHTTSNILFLTSIITLILVFIYLGIAALKRNNFILNLIRFLGSFKKRIVSLNLGRRLSKNILVFFVIFTGIFSFSMINTLSQKLVYDFSNESSFPSTADIIVYSPTPFLPDILIPQIESINGVQDAAGIGVHDELVSISGEITEIFYFDPTRILNVLNLNFIQGSEESIQQLNQNKTIISNVLSLKLNLQVNDTIIVNNTALIIVGIVDDIFSFWSLNLEISNFIFISYISYQNIFNFEPLIYTVFLTSLEDPKVLALQIEQQIPDTICIVTSDLLSNYRVTNSFINLYAITLSNIAALLIILGTLFIITLDLRNRINEMGVYSVLGMKKQDINKILLSENLIILILGFIFAILMAIISITIFFFLYDIDYFLTSLATSIFNLIRNSSIFGFVFITICLIYVYFYSRHILKNRLVQLFRKNLQ